MTLDTWYAFYTVLLLEQPCVSIFHIICGAKGVITADAAPHRQTSPHCWFVEELAVILILSTAE